MATAQDVLNIARGEIGVVATGQNNVKYNTWFYGRTINASGYAWCVVFVFWVMVQAKLGELFYTGYQDGKTPATYSTASCTTLRNYHKKLGQEVTDGKYQAGDLIFFNFSGGTTTSHIGICESFDGTTITTIDGNTSSTSEANGGTVNRRSRNKSYIVVAIRPNYPTEVETEIEEEEELTQEQFNTMMNTYLTERASLTASDWAKDNVDEAVLLGISDGTNPQSFTTRQEAMTMMTRLVDMYLSK